MLFLCRFLHSYVFTNVILFLDPSLPGNILPFSSRAYLKFYVSITLGALKKKRRKKKWKRKKKWEKKKKEKEKSKHECPKFGLHPNQLNQNLWSWRPGIGIHFFDFLFFKVLQVIPLSRQVAS